MKNKLCWLLILFSFWVSSSCDILKKTGSSALSPDNLALDFLNKPQPVTTSFEDAYKEKVLADDFGDKLKPTALQSLPRTGSGGFLLVPGFYELTCKSYCLHPGTAAPGKTKGDGYLYAPLKGDKAGIIVAIIRNAEKKGAWQQDVQSLIWAVLSKASIKDMSPSLQTVAKQLLSSEQLTELNKNAVAVMSKELLAKIQAKLPVEARKIIELENKMREQFANTQTNYEELEKLAVLPGSSGSAASEYKRGRWSKHPDGYFIRYLPNGYKEVKMQVYMPAPGKAFIRANPVTTISLFNPFFYWGCTELTPSSGVAVPANNNQQRLATSGQPSSDPSTGGGVKKKVDEDELNNLKPMKPYEVTHPDYGSKIYLIHGDELKTGSLIIDATTDPELKKLVTDVANSQSGQEKGECGEDVAKKIAADFGAFKFIHESKIGSNNGFDIVVSKDELKDPCMIRIIEAKQIYQGCIVLSYPNKGPQMSNKWISSTLSDMKKSGNKNVGDLATAIESNKDKVQRLIVAVDAKQMKVYVVMLSTDY